MTGIMNYAMKYYGLEKNIPQMIGNFKKYDYIPNINFWNYAEFKKFIQVVDNPIYFTYVSYTHLDVYKRQGYT